MSAEKSEEKFFDFARAVFVIATTAALGICAFIYTNIDTLKGIMLYLPFGALCICCVISVGATYYCLRSIKRLKDL